MYEKIIKDTEKILKQSVDSFEERITKIRAGRANKAVLDDITFPYYGTETPLNQAANITTPEARLLIIKPWDKSNIKAIEKAILASNLGITPSNDGEVIRLPFPQLTEERRRDLTKEVSKLAEEAKISVRNGRRDALDTVKKAVKSADLTEDDKFSIEEDINKITDKYTKDIDNLVEEKNKELMSV